MKTIFAAVRIAFVLICLSPAVMAQSPQRVYRLNSVDLKQRIIWGAECRLGDGKGLAFGGQDQDADDGRPHTRVLVDGEWRAIHKQLRAQNPLRQHYTQAWSHRQQAKNLLARARFIYFQGLPVEDEAAEMNRSVIPELSQLSKDLTMFETRLPKNLQDSYCAGQTWHTVQLLQRARTYIPKLNGEINADSLQQLLRLQVCLELVAETLDAEPPPRAMNCGTARLSGDEKGLPGNTLVYDLKTKLYILFGGDHLDYLSSDTWVFDPQKNRWQQRHPQATPPPRANHRLQAVGDGTIRMTGGFTYSSNTDYVGGQYVDLADGEWIYDIEKDHWRSSRPVTDGETDQLVSPDTRVYRTGAFHPDFFTAGSKPSAAEVSAWLKNLPVNEWVPTNPPHLPRLNRDWGTARIDLDRDMILRWSGGHSAHGGTDVLHYHFATNRWELPFPVEFPLGQLYSNTSYPNGFNFNLRPWMTGHTYQNYEFDPPSGKMIKAGRPRHYYVYDPDLGDWIGRGAKPAAMQYNSCFYTLTLTATPRGIICWDKNGKVHRYDHEGSGWIALEIAGDKLPGAYVDNSTIAYDSKRDRVLMLNTPGYGKPFNGQVWSLDLKTNTVKSLMPAGAEHAHRFATMDRCCYDEAHDLLIIGTYLQDAGEHTPTPAYDCQHNRWITLDIGYSTGKRYKNTTRAFPHGRSDGLMFDADRKLIWGTDTNSQVYVLRLEPQQADVRPLD